MFQKQTIGTTSAGSDFTFGSTTNTNTTGLSGSAPSTSAGLFGQQNTTLGGGGLSGNTSAFGQPATTSAPSLFGTDIGSTPNFGQTSTGLFGATTTQALAFGTNTPTFDFLTNTQKEHKESSAGLLSAKPATSGFGAAASSAFGGFGAAPRGLFGAEQQQTTAPTFEAKPQQTTAPTFEAKPQQTMAPTFEAKPQQTTAPTFGSSVPGTGLFGATTTQGPAFGTNTPTFGFGTNTQKEHKEPSAGLFGAKPATSGFGTPASSTFDAPTSSSFGTPARSSFVAPASSAFGSFGATPGGLFGAKPQQTTEPIFVSSAPASSTTPHNRQPLRFHAVHRESMRISRDGTAVKPAFWMGNGVLFSARPVRIFEKVCFCLCHISDDSAIFFGFTSYDPTTLAHELTLDTIRFMNKPGNCYRFLNRRFYKKDNILSYYFDSAGKVHFEVNWCHKEELLFSVDTNNSIWVLVYLVDIALQFIDPEDPKQVKGCTQNPFEEERRREEAEEVLPPLSYPDPLEPLILHRTKGRNVQFVNEVAERIGIVSSQGYVFTALPMRLGQTIVVQILATRLFFKGSLSIGLTSCDPATLRPCDLPNNVIDLLDRPEYWVVRQNAADHLRRGDEVAVTLTIDGEVQVCVNGSNTVTVAHVDCTVRLWAFVDIYGVTQKVRLLSSKATRVETPPQQLRDVVNSATLTTASTCETVTSLPQIDATNAANHQYIKPSVGLFSAKPATSSFCAPASSAFVAKPQQTTAPTFGYSAPERTTETPARELTIRQPSDRESVERTSNNGSTASSPSQRHGPQRQSTGSLQSDSPASPSPPSPAHFPCAPTPSPAPSASAPAPSPARSPSAPTPSAPTLFAPSPSASSPSAPSPFPGPSLSAASPSPAPCPSAPSPSPAPSASALTPSPAHSPSAPTPSAPTLSAPSPSASFPSAPSPSASFPSPIPSYSAPSPSAPSPSAPSLSASSPSSPSASAPAPSPARSPSAPTPSAPTLFAPSPSASSPSAPSPFPRPSLSAASPSPAPCPSAPSPSPAPSASALTPSPAHSPSAPTPSAPTLSAPSPSASFPSAPSPSASFPSAPSPFPAASPSPIPSHSAPSPSAPSPSAPSPSAPSPSAPTPSPAHFPSGPTPSAPNLSTPSPSAPTPSAPASSAPASSPAPSPTPAPYSSPPPSPSPAPSPTPAPSPSPPPSPSPRATAAPLTTYPVHPNR